MNKTASNHDINHTLNHDISHRSRVGILTGLALVAANRWHFDGIPYPQTSTIILEHFPSGHKL